MADWRQMTVLEHSAALALRGCRFPVASPPKRFARNLGEQCSRMEITDKQSDVLWRYCWTFRRQIADPLVLAEARNRKELECSSPHDSDSQ